jgi:Holliday junction resolvasome RuvABC endonuclease subunit
VDVASLESPVARYGGAVIPQARVSGAILGLLAEKQILHVEVTPQQAKIALTGRGNASKADMMTAAGLDDEHAADAVGVAKAALKQVQVLR